MSAKVEYKLLKSGSDRVLVSMVNEHLAMGWELAGGVAIRPEGPAGASEEYVQAMTKPIKGKAGDLASKEK